MRFGRRGLRRCGGSLPIVDLKMIYTASPMCKVSLVPHPHAHARCEIRSLHQVNDQDRECTTWVNGALLCAELGVVQLSPWPAVRTVREKIN
jgi:hypothetical protein